MPPEWGMTSTTADTEKRASFLWGQGQHGLQKGFFEMILVSLPRAPGSRRRPSPTPSDPSLVFLLWNFNYLHDLVSNLQPSNFSRAPFRYPCDVNTLGRDSPVQALGSLDWPLTTE